jgi:hypothetical protein
MSLFKLLTVVTLGALFVLSGCVGGSLGDPKKTVIRFFGAMEKDDKAALAHLLDLSELMKNVSEDYAFLDDLTGDGLTKTRWFSYQRIINKVEVMGETATVEVTFVNKDQSKGYRTKFGLHVLNEKWKIYSFKAIPDEG